MYAERSRGFQFRPASLGAALAINGGIIAALLTANPEVIERIMPSDPLKVFTPQPDPTPPPPEPRKPHSEQPNPQPTADPLPPRPQDPPLPPLPSDPGIQTGTGGGTVTDSEGGTGTEVVVTPVFVAATYDQRYLDDLQPPYPDTIRDAGTEGVVRLRIVIGTNGRVIRADGLEGDPALLKVATKHALARWRFRPATRGGVPEESTKTMVVRFRIE